MVRSLLSIGSLVAVIGWLFLSYLPGEIFSPPTLSIGGESGFGVIVYLLTAFFFVVSAIIVHSTWRSLRPVISSQKESVEPGVAHTTSTSPVPKSSYRLRLPIEIFWTVVPLVVTLIIIFVSYYAWTLR